MVQAGKPLFAIANWKSHKTWVETQQFLKMMATLTIPQSVKVIIAPSFPYLKNASQSITDAKLSLHLAAQNVSPFPFGAYTGEVTAEMVKDLCQYVIVGHSERRKYFHETHQDIANKVDLVLSANLSPVICVDEPYLEAQVASLTNVNYSRVIFAYEPLAAIGSGEPDTPEHAQTIAQKLRELTAPSVPVLYGGSVTAANIKSFTQMDAINGALVGGASLDPQSWIDLVNQLS